MRLLIVQYAGDYREAVQNLAEGGGETYYAQKYSVDAVAEIGKKIEEVAVICCMTTKYDEIIQNGVRAIGAGFNKKIKVKKLIEIIENQNPTHLIVRTPITEVFGWATKNKIRTMAVLADSFSKKGLRNKIRNYSLVKSLNEKQIEWVFNHGINSCVSLQDIGVKPNKLIPWDWPSVFTPGNFSSKRLRADVDTWEIVYIGSITESKGVGDIIEAIANLKRKNFSVKLKIAGKGELEYFTNKIKQLKIEDNIKFLGLVPNSDVIHLMRKADLVLIPSRHEYPEGLPMTIYEALCSRTPIVASDHPMFKNNLKHGVSAIVFAAGDPISLAKSIEEVLANPELYSSLSVASYEAWERLQIPVKWAEMLNRWLDNSHENQQWLFEHRLSSGRYNSILA